MWFSETKDLPVIYSYCHSESRFSIGNPQSLGVLLTLIQTLTDIHEGGGLGKELGIYDKGGVLGNKWTCPKKGFPIANRVQGLVLT